MSKKSSYTVFIVDDDTKLLTMLKHYLEKNSDYILDVHVFSTGENCLDKMDLNPDVIVLDYYFDATNRGATNGLEILKKIKERNDRSEVIMISGQDKLDIALETMRAGAYDYVIKNDSAMMRTQMVTDKILMMKSREKVMRDYKRGLRITVFIIIIFIVVMLGFLLLGSNIEWFKSK